MPTPRHATEIAKLARRIEVANAKNAGAWVTGSIFNIISQGVFQVNLDDGRSVAARNTTEESVFIGSNVYVVQAGTAQFAIVGVR